MRKGGKQGGFSAVSLLLVDEAARVSDDLYLAIRPTLAVSSGALWLISAPFGKRGFFYEVWERGRGAKKVYPREAPGEEGWWLGRWGGSKGGLLWSRPGGADDVAEQDCREGGEGNHSMGLW